MLDWITYEIPWWLWMAPLVGMAVAIFVAVFRMLGLKAALSAVVAFASAASFGIASLRGRQAGWKDREDADRRKAREIADRINSARNRARDDRRNRPDELFDDDGFRRD